MSKSSTKDNLQGGIRNLAKPELRFYLLLFGLLWIYIWLRAIFTQLTHDETANFFRFVNTGDFLPYSIDTSATNHLLNSFLSWIFYSLLGSDPWVLRLGNVLSFPVFFYFLLKLATLIRQQVFRISFVVVLALSHNMIEFFALSRGYGQSMAFLLAALWFLICAFDYPALRHYVLSLVFAVLALTANLTLLNTVLLIIGILSLRLLIPKKIPFSQSWKHWLALIFLGLMPVAFYADYLFYLKEVGDLYYGMTTGFWQVTVRTLIKTMLDSQSSMIEIFVGAYVVFMLLAATLFLSKKFTIQKFFNSHLVFLFLLLGNVLAVVLLRIIFGVNYPEDRTGLYFLVFFFGGIFFLADLWYQRQPSKKIFLLVIPFIVIPLHFVFNMNLSHNSFENTKIPERFYQKMMEDYKPGEAPPTIGGYKGRVFRWAFINYKNQGVLGKVQSSYYPKAIEDYQIADTANFPDWDKYYDTLDYHPTSSLYLLKRKTPTPKTLVYEKTGISTQGVIDAEYFRFFIIDADSIANSFVEIEFDLPILSREQPFVAWLVANSLDANNQEIAYEYFPLEWLNNIWEAWDNRVVNRMIVKVPKGTHQLNFYIWNKKKLTFWIDDARIKVFKYDGV